MWTLAILVPSPLSASFRRYEDPSYAPTDDKVFHTITPEEEQAHDQATVIVQRHFARLGFLRAGRTPALAEFFFATGDSYFQERGDPWDRILSRDQVRTLELYTKPAPHRMKDADKERRTLLEVHAMNASGDAALQQHCIMADVMRTTRFASSLARSDRFAPSNGTASEVLSKIRDLVLVKGASINDSQAVHCAAEMGPTHLELLVVLLHLGGNPSLPDELGDTPLHAAANSLNAAAMKLLLLAGASTAAVNAEGETPLDRLLARQRSSADFASTFGFAMKSDLGLKAEAMRP
jgi:hypothetical protein